MQLLFVGDVMLGRQVNEALKNAPPAYPWGDTLPFFEQADACICNLECTISNRGTPWSATPKAFHFRADAKNVETLKSARIAAVSLANNHTIDFGFEAFFDTLDILRAANIRYAGAGRNIVEASEPPIWEMQGKKLALLSLTDNEPVWAATEEMPGIWYVPINLNDKRAVRLFEVVKRTRELVDILIVSAHWGPNWDYRPPVEHIPFAHALIDAGADIIFGHSGHVIRGIERYSSKPIIYCTGDFVDDYAIHEVERNDLSFLFIVETDGSVITRLLLYPTVIKNFQARRARGQEQELIVATMQKLCASLGTSTTWNKREACLEVRIARKSVKI